MNAFIMQVRREIWEHRALWIAPMAAAALMLVGAAFGGMNMEFGRMNFDPARMAGRPFGERIVAGSAVAVALFLMVVGSLVIFSYLLDCLYAERKDRSILFWKSLPVSDARTVLTKFAVAMVIVPLSIWALAAFTQLASTLIMSLRTGATAAIFNADFPLSWLTVQARLLMGLFIAGLWYAPVASYLMLASAYARRAPLLVALLPLVLPALGERIVFGTAYVWEFVVDRLFAWNMHGVLVMRQEWNIARPVLDPELWLGLAAAAGMLYIVIRMRRYRDDT